LFDYQTDQKFDMLCKFYFNSTFVRLSGTCCRLQISPSWISIQPLFDYQYYTLPVTCSTINISIQPLFDYQNCTWFS